jgi:hypothetical protein
VQEGGVIAAARTPEIPEIHARREMRGQARWSRLTAVDRLRLLLALVVVTACSEYDLRGSPDDARPGRRQPEANTPDTATANDTSSPPDSADTDIPADTGEAPSGQFDIVMLLDVAYIYDCYHADIAVQGGEFIRRMFASGADVAFAIASYDDYTIDGDWFEETTADGGNPYELLQQLTTDEGKLQAVIAAQKIEYGGDWMGSGLEAIKQAVKGRGYDQNCNGRFDSTYDIRPYDKDASDAFGGREAGVKDSSTPGTGNIDGVGFRKDSRRVVILFAENGLRDKTNGHEIPAGACPGVAGRSDTATAVVDAGAKLLSVNAYEFQDIDTTLQVQLEALADLTGSKIDANGDGAKNERAVLSGSWDWPPTDQLMKATWDLLEP